MFELFEDKDGEWRYHVKGKNGEIMCQSEGYESKANARRGAYDLVNLILAMFQGMLGAEATSEDTLKKQVAIPLPIMEQQQNKD